MDRHKLGQLRQQVEELLRHGSPSCIRQAKSIMAENFEKVLWFALDLSEPEPKPKHTIADNYPAGGLTATEPCMHCKDYEQREEEVEALQADNKRLREQVEGLKEKLEWAYGELTKLYDEGKYDPLDIPSNYQAIKQALTEQAKENRK